MSNKNKDELLKLLNTAIVNCQDTIPLVLTALTEIQDELGIISRIHNIVKD